MAFKLDYFYGGERLAARFFRIPKFLLSEGWELSVEAVTLYGLMLDRVSLSSKNRWVDTQGRVYIYFVQTEVQKRIRCGHNKATALMRELERFGLIERKRQGQGKPAKIYVKNLSDKTNRASEDSGNDAAEPARNTESKLVAKTESRPDAGLKSQKAECREAFFSASRQAVQSDGNGQSGVPESGVLDCPKEAANKTDKKENELIQTNPSIPQPPYVFGKHSGKGKHRMDAIGWIQKELRENIDYENLVMDHPADKDLFDGYVSLMTEACCTSRSTLRICGEDLPAALVRKRFLSLNREHILYVRDCVSSTVGHIGNIKAYTLTALYNAPATMDQYYAALVSRDMAVTEK